MLKLSQHADPLIAAIYADAQTRIKEARHLEQLIDSLDGIDWYSAEKDGLGMELVSDTRRLALMNCLLHGMEGAAQGVDQSETGRMRCFSREAIKARGDSLDISWLKDDSAEDAADLPEPALLAREAVAELNGALAELEAILAELGKGEQAA